VKVASGEGGALACISVGDHGFQREDFMRSVVVAILAGAVCLGAASVRAQAAGETVTADIVGNKGASIGSVQLRGGSAGVVLRVTLKAGSLTPGWHGMHLHASGDCGDVAAFQNAKGHVNHDARKHGLLNAEGPDNGDLPNIYAQADGSASAETYTSLVKLTGTNGLRDADGSALVIHAAEDDHTAQPIGNAGARVGCAVIK
jgi:Cu-Zn family superoxide dismutase